jgi:hypothetical protein
MSDLRYPSLYQINTGVRLTDLSRALGKSATLDDIPDAELDHLAALGFDWVWFLSVWQTGPAAQTKRTGIREYGALAQRYVHAFDVKWLRGGAPAEESLLGSGDIQSLADLSNSFEVVRTMRIAPVTTDALLRLVAATLVPLVPLALTMMSLEDLLKRLIGIVF